MRPIPFILLLVLTLAATTSPAASNPLTVLLEQLGIDAATGPLPPAPIPGFVEVTRGMQVLYVSTDGELVISGDILSVPTETNLSEERRARIRRELLQRVPDDETLIVPATGPTIGRIVVFTDLDCPYCALLHREHEALTQRGIEIRYFFYPRSGPDSASFDQAAAVWCSDDRLGALDAALGGATQPASHCVNPVAKHYDLARKLELRGTPAVITADGRLHYGVHSASDILALLDDPRSGWRAAR